MEDGSEECFFKVSYDDFVMIWMGAGVGYFVIGYLLANCIHNWRKDISNEEILVAREV